MLSYRKSLARMGSESIAPRITNIANEAEGRMGYWLRGHEGDSNNCFSKIQLATHKYRDNTTKVPKCDSTAIVLVFKVGAFRY